MSDKEPVRVKRTALVGRNDAVEKTLIDHVELLFHHWVSGEDEMSLTVLDEKALSRVLALAREAIERRKHDESGIDLPPREPEDGGGGGGEQRCGRCGWCFPGESEEANMPVGKCHVDPPVIWRGVNTWRFLRPEVPEGTPACSRWKPRG